MEALRILLVDDHILFRKGLASLVDNPELRLAHRYIVVENRIDPDQDIDRPDGVSPTRIRSVRSSLVKADQAE